MRRKDFSWNLRFNIARNWNRFLASYDGKDLGDKVLGRPIYGIYTYKDEGSYRMSQLSPTTMTRRVCVYPSPSVRSLTHCVSVVVRSRTRTMTV